MMPLRTLVERQEDSVHSVSPSGEGQLSARTQCVAYRKRDYTVYFGDDGRPCNVDVHVQRFGYTIAYRRLPFSGVVASAVIARAKEQA